MQTDVRFKLSIMMFFQFFMWGAWSVTMGTYLTAEGFSGVQIGQAYSTTAWAAIISPFFVGMVADRFFAAEKVLGIMHIAGGVAMFAASFILNPFALFFVLLLHTLCFMPTLALVNAVSFHNMTDPGKEFPAIRVLGTLGWIAAGWLVSLLKIEATSIPLKIAAFTAVLLGIYCFFVLPSTPPKAKGEKITVGDILGLDALKLLKVPSFAIFVGASLLLCIPLAFYYTFTNPFLNEINVSNAAGKQTFGQMSEVLFMLAIPFFFARLGVKYMLLVGMFAWTLRYFLFAYGASDAVVWALMGGIVLHGICYDFFFVVGQIYIDKKADIKIRASAQGFIAFVTLGVGMLIGNWIAGAVVSNYETREMIEGVETTVRQWGSIWVIPAMMALVIGVVFAFTFNDKVDTETSISEATDAEAAAETPAVPAE